MKYSVKHSAQSIIPASGRRGDGASAPGGRSKCILALWLVVVIAAVPTFAAAPVDIIKSENDRRQYEYLQLENRMQVLLISDPETDKAAAALDVRVGSGDDPPDREGLAHFLEHMLFLGTEKYPEPGEYQEFINAHGGSHNAYTALEHTNYFFDIDAAHLEPALDRFAQFFIAPLFTEKYVDRERHAVHSEYKAKIKDDFRRSLDVLRQLVNPRHPLAQFSVGNLDTLADREQDPVREDLLAFYRRHYDASRMALVVLGKEPLADLKAMAGQRFAKVATNGAAPNRAAPNRATTAVGTASGPPTTVKAKVTADNGVAAKTEPMFPPGFLPSKLYIEPEQDLRRLSFTFPLPRADIHYREKPLQYIGNLLGHEGEGSLLSLLKREGWAEGLSAGEGLSGRNGSVFDITITLTEAGVGHQAQVEALVFKTIALIRRRGLDEWRYREQRQLADIAFRFQEKSDPINTASALANRLHHFEPEDVLRGGYLFAHYDEKLIDGFLSRLNPDNVLIALEAQSVTTDKETELYSAPYRVEKAAPRPAAVKPALVTQLALPEKNQFIPERLEIKVANRSLENPSLKKEAGDAVPAKPQLLETQLLETQLLETGTRGSENFRAWFKHDDTFSVPRASLFLRIMSPAAAQSAQTAALTEMYVRMVNDSLNEFAYPALLAGLQFSVNANSRGLDVEINGYNDKQKILLDRILAALTQADFNPERFANIQREVIRHWRNTNKQQPYQQLLGEMPAAIFQPYWETEKLIGALEGKTLRDLQRFAAEVFTGSRAEMLIYGNYLREEAQKLATGVARALAGQAGGKEMPLPEAKVVKLPATGKGLYTRVEADHHDAAVTLYLQGRDDSIEDMAHMLVLQQVLKAPFFHVLRTEKQLGYIVFVTGVPFKEVPGTALVVQSPSASAQRLIDEISAFAGAYFAGDTDSGDPVSGDPVSGDLSSDGPGKRLTDNLEQHKQAVIANLQEQPKNQFEQARRYWENIVHDVPDFDRRERMSGAVAEVTERSFTDYYRQVMRNPARQWWWVAGEFDPGKTGFTPVLDYDQFKPGQPAYVYP